MTISSILIGKKEICQACGRSWATVEHQIIYEGFPAKFINGRWESDRELIVEWRRDFINGKGKPESTINSNIKPTKKLRKLIRVPKIP